MIAEAAHSPDSSCYIRGMRKLAIFLAACASALAWAQAPAPVVTLELNSVPPGAKLYRTHPQPEFLGYLPYKFKFPRDQFLAKLDTDGCVTTAAYKAEWASGAAEQIGNITLCLGADVSYSKVFERPKGIPGLEGDIEFARLMHRPAGASAGASQRANHQRQDDEAAGLRAFHAAYPNATHVIRSQEFQAWLADQSPLIKGAYQNGRTASEAMVVMDAYAAHLGRAGRATSAAAPAAPQPESQSSIGLGWFLGNLLTGMAAGAQQNAIQQQPIIIQNEPSGIKPPIRCVTRKGLRGIETECN